jgi:hypothetical protein
MESKLGTRRKMVTGKIPGGRLVTLTDSRSTMDEVAEKVRGLVRAGLIRAGEGASHRAALWVRSLG